MASRRPVALTDKEEREMSKLRQKLFESHWDSAEFKAAVHDLVSTLLVQVTHDRMKLAASQAGTVDVWSMRSREAGHVFFVPRACLWSKAYVQLFMNQMFLSAYIFSLFFPLS